MDVDGYKIINVYKPPPTPLQFLDLPMFPHSCLYAGDFNWPQVDWSYDNNSPDGECFAGWASINDLALLYNAKDSASFTSAAGTLKPIQIKLSLAYLLTVAYRIDVSLKSFPGHNIHLRSCTNRISLLQ